jgi:hypothetical protein
MNKTVVVLGAGGLTVSVELRRVLPPPRVTLHEPTPGYHREKEQQERNWLVRWNIREPSAIFGATAVAARN